MSLIIPDSTVNLYADVPISAGHQLVFSSVSAQNTYFLNKRLVTKAGCSYIRKTGRLRIEFNAARVQQCNYMSFTNTSFENVTFYAHILDYEYVNNETTDVLYAIDYWQTYMFDAEFHACSILREHLTEVDYQKAVENPWRRDVPELLTDEGLPCDESLETIYTDGNLSAGIITGNRFKVPSDESILGDPYSNEKYVVFLLSQFDFGAWDSADGEEFVGCFQFFGSLNRSSTWGDFKDMFTSVNQGFVRGTAMLGIRMDDSDFKTKFTTAVNKLTLYSTTASIVGIYVLPKWSLKGYFNVDLYTGYDSTEGFEEIMYNIPKLTGKDPKLNTHPFSYMRVKTPNDVKEYRYDLFKSLSDGTNSVEFKVTCNTNGIPVWSFAPKAYKNDGGYNYYERVDFSNLPQAAFSSDAYLAYLSGQYANAIQTNTRSGMANLRAGGTSTLLNTISPITNAISAAVGGDYSNDWVKNGRMQYQLGMANAPTTFEMSSPMRVVSGAAGMIDTNQRVDVLNEALSARGDGSSAVFDGTKRAFVNDEYHAGSQSGYLPYSYDTLNFLIELVSLNEDILQKYSDYLTIYGYKSLRTGRPHICDYIANGSNTPHFTTFDDETFTYVQTENMHVTGLQANACAAIENLFNAGCRFLKGD